MKAAVTENSGMVDRIHNTECSCIFGLTELQQEVKSKLTAHEYQACYTALKMQTKYLVNVLDSVELHCHIGIHSSEAVIGGMCAS